MYKTRYVGKNRAFPSQVQQIDNKVSELEESMMFGEINTSTQTQPVQAQPNTNKVAAADQGKPEPKSDSGKTDPKGDQGKTDPKSDQGKTDPEAYQVKQSLNVNKEIQRQKGIKTQPKDDQGKQEKNQGKKPKSEEGEESDKDSESESESDKNSESENEGEEGEGEEDEEGEDPVDFKQCLVWECTNQVNACVKDSGCASAMQNCKFVADNEGISGYVSCLSDSKTPLDLYTCLNDNCIDFIE